MKPCLCPKNICFRQIAYYFGDTIDSGTCKDNSERDFGQSDEDRWREF
jgi:hypothetical protein